MPRTILRSSESGHRQGADKRPHVCAVQIGLEFLVDHRGNDPSKWAVTQIFYNGQVFGNTTELNTAFADTTSGLNRQQVESMLFPALWTHHLWHSWHACLSLDIP